MSWQRARTEDKKIERKEAICNAAFQLFKEDGYDKVSFNAIAAEAGFTKSNMYRYFTSKEEIFLNVFTELFEDWTTDCNKRLGKLAESADMQDFAKTWVDCQLAHPKFLDLAPILFLSLERNSSYEQLVIFKTKSKELLYSIAVEIVRVYPKLEIEQAFQFLNLSFAATCNYQAGSRQNEALKKVYRQEIFQELKPDFERDLSLAVPIILKGLEAL
ncbi:MAG: TetR family transcriptional regulator [Spirochaetota bacterium]